MTEEMRDFTCNKCGRKVTARCGKCNGQFNKSGYCKGCNASIEKSGRCPHNGCGGSVRRGN